MTATPVRDFSGLDFPLTLGQVYGLRSWRLDEHGRLRAMHVSAPPWRPGVNVATCKRGDQFARGGLLAHSIAVSFGLPTAEPPTQKREPEKPHTVPTESCACGFYAYSSPDEIGGTELDGEDYAGRHRYAVGVVRGTGRTLIGTKGFRCEKAEIVALLDPTRGGLKIGVGWRREVRRKLRRNYPDVPLLSTWRDLRHAFPIEAPRPDPSSDEFWTMP